MHPVPMLLVTTSLILVAAAGPPRNQHAQCPGQIHPNCGLTDKAGIYKHHSECPGYAACCGMCAADPGNCTAWVFISDGPVFAKGPGMCKLRHTSATCRPDLTNHVSGDLGSPTPPAPPSPPPSPHPSPGPSPPTAPAAGRKPHIVLLVVDDWGFANVGYHRRGWSHDDVDTPNFDKFVLDGHELDRNYVHKFCSPTRSSIQSGRLPVHVNLVNGDPTMSNPNDPVGGWAGIPRNMTGMAQLLKNAQYRTHLVGKWDCGMATPDHTPRGRGYDSSFGYFHHANDYWVEAIGSCPGGGGGGGGGADEMNSTHSVIDLWVADDGGGEHGASAAGNPSCVFCNGSAPAGVDPAQYKPMHNGASLLGVNGSVTDYEEWKFGQYAVGVIQGHNATDRDHPLFLNYNMHVVHEPLQAPHCYFAAQEVLTNATTCPDAPSQPRAIYHSMVKFADDVLGNLTATLRSNHMWEDTLIVVTSDNGGPMYSGNAANNFPLRGYKFSSWEGGIRVIGAVGGGFLDPANAGSGYHRRPLGSRLEGMTHGTDWYATFAALGGVSSADPRAEAAGLPPPDSLNLWPYLSGAVESSPRTSFQIDEQCLVTSPYKLLLGYQKSGCWSGPHVPNATGPGTCTTVVECGTVGCLFDLFADPEERVNLASDPAHARTLTAMQAQLTTANAGIFSPDRGGPDPRACAQVKANGGYWGPFSL